MRGVIKFFKWAFLSILGLAILGLAAFLIFAPAYVDKDMNPVIAHDPYLIRPEVQELHDTLLIGDMHADPTLWKRDLLVRHDRGHIDVPRLIEGNVAVQVFTSVTKSPSGQNYESNSSDAFDNITMLAMGQLWPIRTWGSLFERAVYQAEKLHDFAAASDGRLRVILTRADLDTLLADRAAGQQVVGGILGIEGSHPLEGDIENLQKLVDAGHRVFGLHHFFDNELGGSLHGVAFNGLSDFGREVVAAIDAQGLILDVAHSSPQTAWDVLEMTDSPLIVSHTGIYSHCNTQRNFHDDLMQAIAAQGGVVGIGFWADVTCDASPNGVAGAIIAAVNLLGEDHVALGSDYDGNVEVSFDASEMAALTQALVDGGMGESTIRKVMGENMIRLMRERLR